jgi:hypothetical protein
MWKTEIREAAYRFWEDEWRPHGRDIEHYQMAEGVAAAARSGAFLQTPNPIRKKAPTRRRAPSAAFSGESDQGVDSI